MTSWNFIAALRRTYLVGRTKLRTMSAVGTESIEPAKKVLKMTKTNNVQSQTSGKFINI